MRKLARLGFFALAIAVGCGGGSDDRASGSATSASSARPLAANSALLVQLDAVSSGCSVRIESATVHDCKQREDRALREWLSKDAPTDALETLAGVVLSGDAKARAVAVSTTNAAWSSMTPKQRRENATPRAVDAFLDVLGKDDATSAQIATTATHLAHYGGKQARLLEVLETMKNVEARGRVVRALMTHDRLKAFEAVRKAATDPALTAAALGAPREMFDWSAAEREAICPWAKDFLADERAPVATEAGYVAVRCQGPFVDALLDVADQSLANKRFAPPFSQVLREVCFDVMPNSKITPERAAQCDRTYALLERAANDENVEAAVRGEALWNIYYQRRDTATLELMRRFENHPVPEVGKRARDAIQSLTATQPSK